MHTEKTFSYDYIQPEKVYGIYVPVVISITALALFDEWELRVGTVEITAAEINGADVWDTLDLHLQCCILECSRQVACDKFEEPAELRGAEKIAQLRKNGILKTA